VVFQCLKVLPTQRISAVDLLQHPAIQRNMPASEISMQNNSQTSKCSLLKTILVPKNLKSLKEALPGSKY
jgi:alpha-D-ribose 1-methylphosphonate 5-triphosphate synthase subunit PhnL